MSLDITLILALVALILFAIDEWNAHGRSLTAWGGMALAAIFILGGLSGR